MRRACLRTMTIAACAATSAVLAACDRGEDERNEPRQTASMEQVPPAVKATLTAQAGGAAIGPIERVGHKGPAVYEAHLDANGKQREVRVAEDGKLLPAESTRDDDD